MEEIDKFIILSSYDDEVKYFNDVINDKEHRSPIFTGVGESGKSILTIMVQNGDLDEAKLNHYINKITK